MSFFITLIETTDAHRRALEDVPKVHDMIHRGLTVAEYRAFLHDLYHIVWNFCPIMAAAASRLDDRFRDVRYDLYRRISEERGHELWVLEDLEAVGGDLDAIRHQAPSLPAQGMIACNYHAADRLHPCAVLGMLYTLEVVASVYGGRASDSIARALGRDVDAGGFKFLSSHATMDADHMAEMTVLVKTIQESDAQAAIIDSTRINFYHFAQIFGASGFVAHLED